MTRVSLPATEICRAKSKLWVPESSKAELIPNHMGSLLGYGHRYRWQFRLDSDEFQLAVLAKAAAGNGPFILVLSATGTLILSNLLGKGTAG
jgi:hypothetical protein